MKGFTLIEMLVAAFIFMIIMSIMVPVFMEIDSTPQQIKMMRPMYVID